MRQILISVIVYGLVALSDQQCADYANYQNTLCQCVKGYYSTDPSTIVCQQCPGNTTTSVNQQNISDCNVCSGRLYYVQTPAQATQSAVCAKCPSGSQLFSPPSLQPGESQDQSACNACLDGYYLAQVPSGSGASATAAQCIQCPNYSSTGTVGIDIQKVTDCKFCIQGAYLAAKAVDGSAICQPCLEGVTAQKSSDIQNASNCITCQAGYYLDIYDNMLGAKCKLCPTGTFSSLNRSGIINCVACQKNYYKTQYAQVNIAATCLLCPTGSGNYFSSSQTLDISSCNICLSGFYMTQASKKGLSPAPAQCQQCPDNSTSNLTALINSISSCTCYDQYALPLSSSQKTCQCKPGYGGNVAIIPNSVGCKPCDPGFYSNSGQCTPCPPGTYSQGTSNTSCTPCGEGQFTSNPGSSSCSNCPIGSTNTNGNIGCKCYDLNSFSWSSISNTCKCKANYFGDATLSTKSLTNICQKCLNNGISDPGAAKTQANCKSQYQFSELHILEIILISIFILI
ncbi:GCC2 and GCC3 family protein (macronuclear) [Tetrahymena thermophila SB210]|uniref:GCC2 and GCC3 family protein n=1 Tax=Tetrahymena thermophila (strain SB210) TaxID=312017 RepID=Q228P5_TETTS|nr:GCC2 and GCC3 family protein [Tetrahymena thermophila SB210]EAR81762.1 GCC2 and GCC3 family protein [Tetrahymena thermophila SB210]|eukprot:XP_001029425.1 GCC2 and GCC3 family protein [Tetrahymena thermophila SB210]